MHLLLLLRLVSRPSHAVGLPRGHIRSHVAVLTVAGALLRALAVATHTPLLGLVTLHTRLEMPLTQLSRQMTAGVHAQHRLHVLIATTAGAR